MTPEWQWRLVHLFAAAFMIGIACLIGDQVWQLILLMGGLPLLIVDGEYCGLTVCWREKGHEGKCIGPSGEFDAMEGACAALLADLKALRDEVTERLQRERLMEKDGSNYYAGRADVTLFMHGELGALIRRHEGQP